VLILARFEGLSYREIAQTLEITEGAVESRLFRAMRNLEKAQEAGA
jgi:RNA polymerase sigma factor (sigma-70 family)